MGGSRYTDATDFNFGLINDPEAALGSDYCSGDVGVRVNY